MSSVYDMFGFGMMGNYEERKVARWPDDKDKWIVDTVAVNDSAQPYETAIQHPGYNDGKIIVVEMYDTKKLAQEGHDRWIETMSADKLPERLVDVSTCFIASLASFFDEGGWRQYPKM